MAKGAKRRHHFNLQRAIELDEGKSIPIAGGTGLSADDPIIITDRPHPFAVMLEPYLTRIVCCFYRFNEASQRKQALCHLDPETSLDRITVEYADPFDRNAKKSIDIYYDISAAFRNIMQTQKEVRTSTQSEKDQETTSSTEPIVKVLGYPIALALNSTAPLDEKIILQMQRQPDRHEAANIIAALRDCGALHPSSRGMVAKFKDAYAAKQRLVTLNGGAV